jgi:Domain of unknown function (DUF4129)
MNHLRVEQRLAPAERAGTRRGRTALVLALMPLLIVVAGIASGRSLAHVGGPGRVLHAREFESDALVVVTALSLVVLVIVLRYQRWAPSEAPPSGLKRLRSQLLLLAWMIGAFLLARYLGSGRHGSGAGGVLQPLRTGGKESSNRLPPVHWWGLAVVAILLLVGGIVAWRATRSTDSPAAEPADAADELRDAIEISLADVESEPDPRRAVIRAYARMEQVFARQGLARLPSETAIEHLRRTLRALRISGGAVERLATLFERAKFSSHQVDAGMKHDALVALADVQAELGER